ncbi:hypothetical protein Deipr_2444 (plasmid) [Deinococcus proteolyticus MRP]|uniref:Pilin A4 domain-containing protein n=1 Tax=Deinococcus proteolyticus (strain ATCC 35074 / DSM 20540 / JCM 6276 / NBRC 101906 / NCIMB 13154 / VKM Ac-1939 / CCM 2703 / MRP) TaxID=693977 RepID=F0RQK2_DEIPM|nr:prepilin-type N-terminal cleavage/methylation domain-containing protein [Deinococcus proteolyticus]ADY27561.1 hypothetical protein Deipr_2444 [Deinococcus proteolyticus MRP]
MRTRIQAFTLTELLIVIGLIGLLAAVLIPNLSGARRSGEKNATRDYLATCLNAAEQKRNFHSGELTLPASCTDLVGTSASPLTVNTITESGGTYTITLTDSSGETFTETLRKAAP